MKNLKTILFISSLLFTFSFSAEEEEEVRTIEKDGNLYKIDSTSLHITPYSEDNAIMKATEDAETIQTAITKESKSCKVGCLKDCCASLGCDLTFSIGTSMPMGSDDFDPGASLSVFMPTDWSFDLFGKTWDVSGEMNFSSLSGISGDDASIIAGIAHFDPSFDLPVDITFGVGVAKSDQLGGISGTGLVDVSYGLPFEKCDLSLGFRYQKIVDVSNADGIELDFGLLDTFGFNLQCNKSF
jgi:hypothetical protein